MSIASRLGCDGLWWDTICIPRERKARSVAIDTMLQNYEMAAYTVVHDQDLVKFEWKDDGTPAVALILSSWFTRGWTAAELFASRSHPVKVIYKNPLPEGPPLLKDLDHDILAWDNSKSRNRLDALVSEAQRVPELGHYIVTDIIRNFRDNIIYNGRAGDDSSAPRDSSSGIQGPHRLRGLLRIMRGRTTSWARDRMLIPGLMCLPPEMPVSTLTSQDITTKLLGHFQDIEFEDLLHTEVPICQFGRWSWCPSSIFHLNNFSTPSTYKNFIRRNSQLFIHPSGWIESGIGRLMAYSVLEDDVIIPAGVHPSIRARVLEALTKRSHCMLLSNRELSNDGRLYILFMPTGVTGQPLLNVVTVHCQWIGCVYLGSRGSSSTESPTASENVQRQERPKRIEVTEYCQFRFGGDDHPANETLEAQYVRCHSQLIHQGSDGDQVGRGKAIVYLSDWVENEPCDKTASPENVCHAWRPQAAKLHVLHRVFDTLSVDTRLTTMIVDLRTPENKIALSTVTPKLISEQVSACNVTHDFRCGGQVELPWEIEGPVSWGQEIDIPQKHIFHATFHIVSQVVSRGQSTGISIGQECFKEHFLFSTRKVFSLGFGTNIEQRRLVCRVGVLLGAGRRSSSMTWEHWIKGEGLDCRLWGRGVHATSSVIRRLVERKLTPEEIDRNEVVSISIDEFLASLSDSLHQRA